MHHNKETMDSGCCLLQLSKVETRETENKNQMKELLYRQKYSYFHESDHAK